MGRPGLTNHGKFLRLSRILGSEALARGHLELIWEVGYESGDPRLGAPEDVEAAARWRGEPGALFAALVACKGPSKHGFIEEVDGFWEIHDLWDHAPDYVRKRAAREAERRTKGRTLDAEHRAVTGQNPVSDRSLSPPRAPAPARAPAPTQEAFAGEPPPPAPPKKKPPKADAPPPDPRHAPLVKRLCDIFLAKKRKKYPFDGRAAKVVSELLAVTDSPDAVAAAWDAALDHRGFPSVETLQELQQHLPRFLPELPPAEVERHGPGALPRPAAHPGAALDWDAMLGALREEGKTYALSWLQRLVPVAREGFVLTLQAPDEHFLAWVQDHYGELLVRLGRERSLTVQLRTPGPAPPVPAGATVAEQMQAEDERHATMREVLQVVRDAAVGGS